MVEPSQDVPRRFRGFREVQFESRLRVDCEPIKTAFIHG